MSMSIKELNDISKFEATVEMRNGRAIVKMNGLNKEDENRW